MTFLEDAAQRLSHELAARRGNTTRHATDNDPSWLDADVLPPLLQAYDSQLQHLEAELQRRTDALTSLTARMDTVQATMQQAPAPGPSLPLLEQRVALLQEENGLLRQQAQELETALTSTRQAADGQAAQQLQLTMELGSAAAQVGAAAADAAEAKRQYAAAKVAQRVVCTALHRVTYC